MKFFNIGSEKSLKMAVSEVKEYAMNIVKPKEAKARAAGSERASMMTFCQSS